MIDLDEISNDNKNILKTYTLKNKRIPKEEIFIPFLKEDNVLEKNDINKQESLDIKEEKTLVDEKLEIYDSFKEKELKEEKNNAFDKKEKIEVPIKEEKIEKVEKKKKVNKIDININEYLVGEYKKYKEDILKEIKEQNLEEEKQISKSTKSHKDFIPTKVPDKSVTKETDEVSFKNKKEVASDISLSDLFDFNASQKINKKKISESFLSNETLGLLKEVYGYLFDTLETFSAVFMSYDELFRNIEKIKTFQPSKNPSPINVKNFLYQYRKADSLSQKINIIALAIGNYNLHLIVDKYKNYNDFMNYKKETFLKDLELLYNGNEYDIAYLKEFLKVVRGDLSGKYIFEELENASKEKKDFKEEKSDKNKKKEITKKKSLFSSFNNKK